MRRLGSWRALAIAVVAAGALGSLAMGATSEDSASRGATTYRIYCGSCHGRTAKGDGKLAASLRQAPPDLTQLANRNGGSFDADAVKARIDGREAVASHGDSDMPVWGYSFAQAGDDEAEMAARLADLVAFLKSVQAPAGK